MESIKNQVNLAQEEDICRNSQAGNEERAEGDAYSEDRRARRAEGQAGVERDGTQQADSQGRGDLRPRGRQRRPHKGGRGTERGREGGRGVGVGGRVGVGRGRCGRRRS
jgi:hypothetical protein